MTPLGIIPARGGSKGVKRKNIRIVGGKPLLAFAIEAAIASRRLARFVVSTDDEEIAEVATKYGAEVSRRPSHLAQDNTPAFPVIEHLLAELDPGGRHFDSVVYLQPTTPMRTAGDIDAAIELLETSGADSVVSVYRVEDHHPARMYRISDGCLTPYDQEPPGSLRQQLPAVYHRNGAIYACRRTVVETHKSLIGKKVHPLIMPRSRSVNIDDEMDLLLADLMLSSQPVATSEAA